MRRILCCFCALALFMLPGGAASAAEGDGAPVLLDLLAGAADAVEPFEGAPGARTAWALLQAAVSARPALLVDGVVSEERLSSLYAELFAQGELPPPPEGAAFAPCEGGYAISPGAADAVREARVLGVEANAGRADYDVVVLSVSGGETRFLINMIATVAPDAAAPFGGRLTGLALGADSPRFVAAEATAQLGETYRPENALDGDSATCWSYNEGRDPLSSITLVADETQMVRGLMIMPQNGKDEAAARGNNRARQIRVSLSDGYTVTEEIDELPFCDAWDAFALDRAHEAEWIEIQVLDVYEGETYDDTCISEIVVF